MVCVPVFSVFELSDLILMTAIKRTAVVDYCSVSRYLSHDACVELLWPITIEAAV